MFKYFLFIYLFLLNFFDLLIISKFYIENYLCFVIILNMEIKCRKYDKKYKIKLYCDEKKDNYKAYVLDDVGDVMGFIYFHNITEGGPTWLEKIFVEEKYRFLGVGQVLLDLMEYISSLKNISFIEGRFYPENTYAEKFYKKNNYSIGYGTWDFIYKNLNIKKIIQDVSSRIFNYEESVIKKENKNDNNQITSNKKGNNQAIYNQVIKNQLNVLNFKSIDNKIENEIYNKANKIESLDELEPGI